ncbi:MAG TPA: 3-hydroxyacyl-ACP dehydratase FabZ [Terriglobales bacterium]|nr:3-hydroxyacyl-ACP dehydratase FabZ [Terriglobales bacterium]
MPESAPQSAPALKYPLPMGIAEIERLLPHRYPFLMLDRIVEFEPAKRIVAIKNVTINEPFFQGHFPGHPIMPGVLVLEALAQAGALMILHEDTEPGQRLIYFTGVDACRFRRPVVPGDQLRLEVVVLGFRSNAGRMQGRAMVGDKLAAEGTLSCAVVAASKP